MILSYLTHKKIELNEPGLKILATKSEIAYRDWIQAFKSRNEILLCCNDNYEKLELNKTFDFIGDPLLSGDVLNKYLPTIIKKIVSNLDEDSRNTIISKFYQFETTMQDSLLLEDIPIEVNLEEDLAKLLKFEKLHFDSKIVQDPYAIIETVMKIHEVYNIGTIPVFCNVSHYLDSKHIKELSKVSKQMNMQIILIEFTDKDFMVVPDNAEFYYIDQDLVDWY